MRRKLLLMAGLFGLLGFAGNWFKLPLFLNVDFLFGSFFVMLAILRAGFPAGSMAGFIASSCTILLWNHPWAVIIFTAEAVWVGWLCKKRDPADLLLYDMLYWLVCGAPLVWIFYHLVLGSTPSATALIMLKQSINGIFNALFASLVNLALLSRFPNKGIPLLSYRQVVFAIMSALVLVPCLALMLLNLRDTMAEESGLLAGRTARTLQLTREFVGLWVRDHHQVIRSMAKSIGDPSTLSPGELQRRVAALHGTASGFSRMVIVDANGVALASYPPVGGAGGAAVSNQTIAGVRGSATGAVFVDTVPGGGAPRPQLILSVPLVTDGTPRGYGLGIIDTAELNGLLGAIIGDRQMAIRLMDAGKRIAIASHGAPALTPYPDRGMTGAVQPITSQVQQWIPPKEPGKDILQRWTRSVYTAEAPLGSEIPVTVAVAASFADTLENLSHETRVSLVMLAGIILLVIPLSRFLSSRLVSTLQQLQEATKSLPVCVAADCTMPLPSSSLREVDGLIENFRTMAETLVAQVGTIRGLNETLENKVAQRTKELEEKSVFLAALLDSLRDIVIFKDLEGVYLGCNRALEQTLGKDRSEIVGKTDYDLFSQGAAERFRADDRQVVESGKPLQLQEEAPVPDGAPVQVSTIKSPLIMPNGDIIGIVGVARDISDQVRAEKMLRSSEANFRTFFDLSFDLLFVLDMAGNILLANHTACERLGYAEGELTGTSVLMLHPAELRDEAARIVQAMVAGSEQCCPLPLQARDGSRIPVETRVLQGMWNGQPALFGTCKDISELAFSEEKFAKAFEFSAALMAISTVEEGCYINVNRTFLDTLGYKRDEVLGRTSVDLGIIANRNERDHLREEVKRRGEVSNVLLTVRTKEGQFRTGLFSAQFIRIQTSRYLLSVFNDITDLKRAEEELRSSEARWQYALEGAGDGLWDWNAETNRVFYSPQWKGMLGFQVDEIGDTLAEWDSRIHPDDRQGTYAALNRHLLGEVAVHTSEHRLRCKDGSYKWILARGKVIEWTPTGAPLRVIGTHSDISGRKEMEQALVEQHQKAASASQAKSEFLANMSHEVRTPLNGILGMAQLLQMTEQTEEQQVYVENMYHAAQNLLAIVNDILDLAKIESGKLSLDVAGFSIRKCVESAVITLSPAMGNKKLSIKTELAAEVPDVVQGDQVRFKQILFNLLGNAVKFTHRGTICLACTVAALSDSHVTIRLSVADTGIGIAPENLESIFEPFEQAGVSAVRTGGGTGLGLSICRRLVEMMDGRIWAESVLGQGSTFHVELSFPLALHSGMIGDDHQASLPMDSECSLSILIAEDNQINRVFATALLGKLGHSWHCVENGRDAVAAWRSGTFDCILMDIRMPVMGGEEAAELIRAEETAEEHIPIFALTAHSLKGDRDRLLAGNFDGYLSKPLAVDQLMDLFATLNHRAGSGQRGAGRWPGEAAGVVLDNDSTPYPGIDFETGIERLDGDRGFFVQLLADFAERYGAVTQVIARAIAAGELDKAAETVHSLKGVAAYLALPDVYRLARALEILLAGRDLSGAAGDQLDQLQKAIAVVISSTTMVAGASSP